MVGCSSCTARLLLALAIMGICVGCDQATKRIATQALKGEPPRTYFGDTIRLEYALNPGGFLSLGSHLTSRSRFVLFVVLNTSVLVAVAYLLTRRWNMRLTMFVALTLFFSGGVGNLIDRVMQDGLVTDFIIVGIGPVRTGIFNVADMAVMFGGLLYVVLQQTDRGDQPSPQVAEAG